MRADKERKKGIVGGIQEKSDGPLQVFVHILLAHVYTSIHIHIFEGINDLSSLASFPKGTYKYYLNAI